MRQFMNNKDPSIMNILHGLMSIMKRMIFIKKPKISF